MKIYIFLFLFLVSCSCFSQDLVFTRKMVDTLASPVFWGRGYTKEGMHKAADFLASQFRFFGLQPVNDKSFFQEFFYPVNTFPGKMKVKLNGEKLDPGKDFIVSPGSGGGKGKVRLVQRDSIGYSDPARKAGLFIENKLTWSVAQKAADHVLIELDKTALKAAPLKLRYKISNRVVNFNAFNICGMVRGTRRPDSMIVLSAHYDHLGGMGKDTYFPGANDNASGVSMLLSLAKYYTANPQPYSVVFILFAGEEAGLLGSRYFTEHPLIPLDRIRFLVNMDMVGTGDEGITAVNGLQYPAEFSLLSDLNNAGHYLVKVNARGKAANSDHYWFTEKGVPAFFIYTLGGIKAYHDVFDRAETLPLNEYEDLFRLIVEFNRKLIE